MTRSQFGAWGGAFGDAYPDCMVEVLAIDARWPEKRRGDRFR